MKLFSIAILNECFVSACIFGVFNASFIKVIVAGLNPCKSNPDLFKLIKDIHYLKKSMEIKTKSWMYLILHIVN